MQFMFICIILLISLLGMRVEASQRELPKRIELIHTGEINNFNYKLQTDTEINDIQKTHLIKSITRALEYFKILNIKHVINFEINITNCKASIRSKWDRPSIW